MMKTRQVKKSTVKPLCALLERSLPVMMKTGTETYSWSLSTGRTKRERRNSLMLKMPRRKTRRGRQQTRKGQHLFLTGDKSLKEASAMIPTTKGHHPLSAQSLTRLRRVTKRESEYLTIYLFRHMVYMLSPSTWAFVCCPDFKTLKGCLSYRQNRAIKQLCLCLSVDEKGQIPYCF